MCDMCVAQVRVRRAIGRVATRTQGWHVMMVAAAQPHNHENTQILSLSLSHTHTHTHKVTPVRSVSQPEPRCTARHTRRRECVRAGRVTPPSTCWCIQRSIRQ
jgi:hypothetical protein